RRFVAAFEFLACLDQAEGFRCLDAERFEHLRPQDFPPAALQGQAAIRMTRPWRLPAAFGGEIEKPAVLSVAKLSEQEPAAIAEMRIVAAELMAVIAQGERLFE